MYSNFKEKAIGGASPAAFQSLLSPPQLTRNAVRPQCCNECLRVPAGARAEYVKEAVQEDQAGNYQKAFDLYKIALEYFSTHLKYEKNPRSKAAISEKARLPCARARTPTCPSSGIDDVGMYVDDVRAGDSCADVLNAMCAAQFKEYLERAEYIKSVIDGQVTVPQASGTGQKARTQWCRRGQRWGAERLPACF